MLSQTGTKRKPRVAIIGGGIFGVTSALVLAKFCDVGIFERSSALLRGATFANHGRQHFGFHYPRSPETARQCLESHRDFQSFYGAAEITDFPNYYCIAADHTKTSSKQYLEFCDGLELEYVRELPPDGVLSNAEIALSIRVKEGVIDYETMKDTALALLKQEPSIRVETNRHVSFGEIGGEKGIELTISGNGEDSKEIFDFVINATYSHFNSFCQWFGFPARKFQYNLQELNIIELPHGMRVGITVMDGPFPSIIPMGHTPYHLLAHVNASQLIRESSTQATPLLSRVSSIESNWNGILEASAQYLPILRNARYIKSLFVDRVVDSDASLTDARLTDLTDHGNGCYSIFAAKVITCVSTARKLAAMIANEL